MTGLGVHMMFVSRLAVSRCSRALEVWKGEAHSLLQWARHIVTLLLRCLPGSFTNLSPYNHSLCHGEQLAHACSVLTCALTSQVAVHTRSLHKEWSGQNWTGQTAYCTYACVLTYIHLSIICAGQDSAPTSGKQISKVFRSCR